MIAVPNGPVGLDPQKSAAASTLTVTQLIYSSLLTHDAAMNFRGDLAESFEVESDTSYLFRIRPDAVWHDGSPVTSEDVKYSLERMIDPDTGSPWNGLWSEALDRIETPDEHTVRILTNGPFAPLLSYLASPWYSPIVHRPTVEANSDLQQVAMGTGPFMLESMVENNEVVLVRNPNYYVADRPYLDEVVFRIVPNEASQLAALRAGTVDLMWSGDPLIEQQVRGIDDLQLFRADNLSATPAFWFNQTGPPFDDVRVRRALSVGIDRLALIQAVLRGQGQISTKIPPSSPHGYHGDGSDLPYYQHDPELARQLLAEAGYADGLSAVIEIPTGFPIIQRASEVMQEQLAQVGMTIELRGFEYGDALTRCIRTEQEGMCAIRHVWQPDPSAYLDVIYRSDSAINLGKFNDATVDALLEQGRMEIDVEARIAIYQELERHVADQVLVVVPFANDFVDLLSGDFAGYQPLPGGATPGTRSLLPLIDTWRQP